MTDKGIEWCRWNKLDDNLQIDFTNILSGDDKTILDGIVAACPENSDIVSETCFCLKISDFVESLDGTNNNINVDKLIDAVNNKVGKRVSSNVDNQDCDFDILILLSNGFTNFSTNAIQLDFRASDVTGNNNITVRVYGTDKSEVGTGFNLTPSVAEVWETKTITSEDLSGGTFVAGQIFRIRIHVTVDNTDTIDMSDGEVRFV